MTHARNRKPAPPWGTLEGIAEASDLMRQLSDLFVLAPGCRHRACRAAGRCRGGEGPPCFHEHRDLFIDAMRHGLRATRRFWKRQRALAAERKATRASRDSPPQPPSGEGYAVVGVAPRRVSPHAAREP
jgi:hypothetical protein